MRTIVTIIALAALGGAMPASAHMKHKMHHKTHSHAMMARGAQATKITIDGTEYAVCTAAMTDNCVNPREAGLKFGNVPLGHWPGVPASEGGK